VLNFDASSTAKRLSPLGGIATIEMSVRGVGGTSLADVLQPLADWLLVGLAITLSRGWAGQVITELSLWALYAYAVYTFLPDLFPDWLSDLAEDRIFISLVAIGVIVLAQPVVAHLSSARQFMLTGSIGATDPSSTFGSSRRP